MTTPTNGHAPKTNELSSRASEKADNCSSRPTKQPDDRSSRTSKQPDDRSSRPRKQPDDRSSKLSKQPDDRSSRPSKQPDDRPSRPSKRPDNCSSRPGEQPDDHSSRPSKQPDDRSSRPSTRPNDRSKLQNPKSKIIGYYSIDGNRQFLNNASKLMYYNPPNNMKVYTNVNVGVNLDLDAGVELAIRRGESFFEEGIELLLQWIKINHNKIRAPEGSGRWIKPQFVCSRGDLNGMLTKRVLSKDTWVMYACKWKGTIYINRDKKTASIQVSNDKQIRCCAWGHKFEKYILTKSPDELPDSTKPVIETEEFRCVYQRYICGHDVMFCARAKGLISNEPLKEPLPLHRLNFIDLKTNKIIEHTGHLKTLQRSKLIKWWANCELTNTENVICGFRDESGVVNALTLYNINQIIEQGKGIWNPGCCFIECKEFLTKIKETVLRECTESIYRFEKLPGGQIDIKELPASSENSFLETSFLELSG